MKIQNFKNITYCILCVYTLHIYVHIYIYVSPCPESTRSVQNLQAHNVHTGWSRRTLQFSVPELVIHPKNTLKFFKIVTSYITFKERTNWYCKSVQYILFQLLYLLVPDQHFCHFFFLQPGSWTADEKLCDFLAESIWSNVILLCNVLMLQSILETSYSRNLRYFLHQLITKFSN